MWRDSRGKRDITIIFTIKHLQKAKLCVIMHTIPLNIFVEIMSIMKLTSCSYTTGKNGGGEYKLKNSIPSEVLYKWPESFLSSLKETLISYILCAELSENQTQSGILWVAELLYKLYFQPCRASHGNTRTWIEKKWDPENWTGDIWEVPSEIKAGSQFMTPDAT